MPVLVALKRLRARARAANAARVTVQRHVSLPARIGIVVLVAILGAALALGGWQLLTGDAALSGAELEREASELRAQVATLASERERLSAIVNAADATLTVERTAAQQLAERVKITEAENARLRADLAYLESLLPAPGRDEPVAIHRLRVATDGAPHQLRYQALLTQRPPPAAGAPGAPATQVPREFRGTIALTVQATLEGKPLTLQIPPQGADAGAAMKVSFTRYQRIDGRFELPPGAVLRSVQMRLFEGSAVRAQQSATP